MSTPEVSPSGFSLSPPNAEERKRLEADLTREEAEVLLHHGTEAPFCGGLLDQKDDGVYCCRLCGLPLFQHKTKFESGTGWPSFWAPVDEAHVKAVKDVSYGMIRTAISPRLAIRIFENIRALKRLSQQRSFAAKGATLDWSP